MGKADDMQACVASLASLEEARKVLSQMASAHGSQERRQWVLVGPLPFGDVEFQVRLCRRAPGGGGLMRYDDWLATDPRDLEPQEEEHEEYPEQCDACGGDGDLVVLDPERAHMHQVCHECNAAMIAEEDEER